MDPGESWDVTVELINVGTESATSVEASLSATGVTMCTGTQTFGTMNVSDTVSRTFTFVVNAGFTCGDDAWFNIVGKTSDQGNYPDENNVFSRSVGTPGFNYPKSYPGNTSIAITELSPVTDSVTPDAGDPHPAVSVDIHLTVTHERINDVNNDGYARLRLPDSSTIDLTPLETGVEKIVSITTEYNLAANGPGKIYTLEVMDGKSRRVGTIDSWSLEMTLFAPAVCNTWSGQSCAGGSGPPPVASGMEGTPVTLVKGSGNDISVSFDKDTCNSDHAVMVYGSIGNWADYIDDIGGDCNLGATGGATVSVSLSDVWFNLVWVAADGTAGHPGAASVSRSWNATGLCSVSSDDHGDTTCN